MSRKKWSITQNQQKEHLTGCNIAFVFKCPFQDQSDVFASKEEPQDFQAIESNPYGLNLSLV